LTENDTIVRPTVEQVLSGKVENYESIQAQTSIAGGKEGTGITMTSEWMIQMKSKRILFLGGWAETRVSRFPIEPMDVPDRHIREIRRVARAIFEVKRFDGIELFDSYPGEKMSWIESKKMSFVEKRDAVLWCALEGYHDSTEDIKTFSLNNLEEGLQPQNYTRAKSNAQKNSAQVWNSVFHLILQMDSGHKATETLQDLQGKGIERIDLERFWLRLHDTDELPVYLKNLFPVE